MPWYSTPNRLVWPKYIAWSRRLHRPTPPIQRHNQWRCNSISWLSFFIRLFHSPSCHSPSWLMTFSTTGWVGRWKRFEMADPWLDTWEGNKRRCFSTNTRPAFTQSKSNKPPHTKCTLFTTPACINDARTGTDLSFMTHSHSPKPFHHRSPQLLLPGCILTAGFWFCKFWLSWSVCLMWTVSILSLCSLMKAVTFLPFMGPLYFACRLWTPKTQCCLSIISRSCR